MNHSNLKHRRPLAIALLFAIALALGACDDDYHDGFHHVTGPSDSIVGSGILASETRAVSGFNGVVLSGAGHLSIEQTGFESLEITTDDNVLPLLTSDVLGGRLELGVQPGYSVSPTQVDYRLTVAELNEIVVSGAADIDAAGLDTGFLEVVISGAAAADLSGRADLQNVAISGAASYHAAHLRSSDVRISVSGSAHAVVRASDRLEVSISGSGTVEYYGNPEVHASGNGTVRRLGP